MTHTAHHFEGQITRSVQLDYLIYLPPGYDDHPAQNYPVIVYLHGAGGRGDDLDKIKAGGIPYNLEHGQELPFVVVSPQCPAKSHWTLHIHALNALLDEIVARFHVDDKRIYLTGASMGGAGVWFLAANFPTRFAAIVPLCGRIVPLPLTLLADVPIWAFHGALDEVIPLSETQRTVDALIAVGADVTLTVYPDAGHNISTQTYDNPELYNWLLSHQRT